jgi:hypothetical protein
MQAVNRRGRTIGLRVAVTPLLSGADEPSGALLLIEPHDDPIGRGRRADPHPG